MLPAGSRGQAFKECDCTKRVAAYTMMAYDCGFDDDDLDKDCDDFYSQQTPLPVFSSPKIVMSGMTV
jgi:hypothetical protein